MNIDHLPDDWKAIPQDGSYAIFDPDGIQRCGSKNSKGLPCKKYPIKDRLRCKTHGGKTARGEFHHNHEGKGYSRFAPPALRRRIDMMAESDVTDLTQNAILLDARITQLLERTQEGSFGSAAVDAHILWNRAANKFRNGKPQEGIDIFNELGALIRKVQQDYLVWNDLIKVNRERRDMAQAIHKMTMQSQGMMTAPEVLTLILRITDAFIQVNQLKDEIDRRNRFQQSVSNIIEFKDSG